SFLRWRHRSAQSHHGSGERGTVMRTADQPTRGRGAVASGSRAARRAGPRLPENGEGRPCVARSVRQMSTAVWVRPAGAGKSDPVTVTGLPVTEARAWKSSGFTTT